MSFCAGEPDNGYMTTAAERRYTMNLVRHPDCRDPDHPGCPSCEHDEDESDEYL